jgi:hypothetical protein
VCATVMTRMISGRTNRDDGDDEKYSGTVFLFREGSGEASSEEFYPPLALSLS